jgi:hypothetical protein
MRLLLVHRFVYVVDLFPVIYTSMVVLTPAGKEWGHPLPKTGQ